MTSMCRQLGPFDVVLLIKPIGRSNIMQFFNLLNRIGFFGLVRVARDDDGLGGCHSKKFAVIKVAKTGIGDEK